MEMDTQSVNSKRQCLSGSSFLKTILVCLLLCMLLLANHIEIPIAADGKRNEPDQQNVLNATPKVQERLKNINEVTGEGARYKTFGMTMKHVETKSMNEIHNDDKSDGDNRPNVTIHYGQDDGSDYIKTKYIMHKILKENGPNLSAKQRAHLVKERCETFLKENNLRLNHNAKCRFDHEIMISRRYNLTICYNCKVASTNTKRVLYALDHNLTHDINSLTVKTVGVYGKKCRKNFQQIMSEKRHISVMMVREPLERLVSAYRDKRAYMYKKQFKNPSFTFTKYLKLILEEKMKNMDRHIYPHFERCRPCEMQFDFIGLPKRFNDDIKTVLQEIGASGKVDIPKRNETGYNFKSSDKLLKQYFKKVPNDIIHKLWEKYYKDYYIFGFPYPAHLMN